MTPCQALPPYSPQHVAAADPLCASTDTGRAPLEDTSNANDVKARASSYTEGAQEAAQQAQDDIHGMAQQAKQQQPEGMVDQIAVGCNTELGGASRQSQAGMRTLLLWSFLLLNPKQLYVAIVCVRMHIVQNMSQPACFQTDSGWPSCLCISVRVCLSVCLSVRPSVVCVVGVFDIHTHI